MQRSFNAFFLGGCREKYLPGGRMKPRREGVLTLCGREFHRLGATTKKGSLMLSPTVEWGKGLFYTLVFGYWIFSAFPHSSPSYLTHIQNVWKRPSGVLEGLVPLVCQRYPCFFLLFM